MPKSEVSDQIEELSKQISNLDKKIVSIDAKITSVENSNQAVIANTQKIVSTSEFANTTMIMENNIADPNGFIARELTNNLYTLLQNYQNTSFRRWLAVSGRKVVEASISGFVSSKLPQLRWYNIHMTKLPDGKYHQTAKTSLPVELRTGIPVINVITLAKCVFEVEGDIDSNTKEFTNLKTKLTMEQMDKEVWASFFEEVNDSLKPHKTTYAVLSPIGHGIRRLFSFLQKETNFSYPFLLLLVSTIIWPTIWPAYTLYYYILRWPFIAFWLLGINIMSVILGLINGLIYGVAVWAALKYKLLEKMRVFGFLTKINKPGGPQINLRLAAIAGIVIIAVIAGGWWWWSLPKGLDITYIRGYSDPAADGVLKAINAGQYTSATPFMEQNMKTVLTEPAFAGYRLYIKNYLGNYTSTAFVKAGYEGNVLAVYYNSTYTRGYVTSRMAFEGSSKLLSKINLDSATYKISVP